MSFSKIAKRPREDDDEEDTEKTQKIESDDDGLPDENDEEAAHALETVRGAYDDHVDEVLYRGDYIILGETSYTMYDAHTVVSEYQCICTCHNHMFWSSVVEYCANASAP